MAWEIPQLRYSDVAFDPSTFGDLAKPLREGLDRRATRQAFKDGIPTKPDGSPDYAAMATKLYQSGNVDAALGLTRLAETSVQNEYLRGRPSYQEFGGAMYEMPNQSGGMPREIAREPRKPELRNVSPGQTVIDENNQPVFSAPAAPPKPHRQSATELKGIWGAEDENVNLTGTVSALERALQLNDQAFTGMGAGTRANLGGRLPDAMVPDIIADPKGANATIEWQTIMSPEAIQLMGATLSGATTDFELRKFEGIMADPTTPPNVRKATIQRMLALAKRKQGLNQSRIEQMRTTGSEEDLIAGPEQPPAAPRATNPQTGETVEWNGSEWIPVQ